MARLHWHENKAFEKNALPALFLHGFMGSGEDWQPIFEALGPDFHCLAPDLPGHGRTRIPPENSGYTMEQCVRALREDLEEHGIERSAVIGYSMGGRLALYLAVRHPEQVTQLVLESASPGLADEEHREQRRELDIQRAGRLCAAAHDRAAFRVFLEEWYGQPLFSSLEKHPELREALIERRLHNDPLALAQSLEGMGSGAQPSLWEALDGVLPPTLLIAGDLDRKFRLIAERMSEARPQIAVYEMLGCGHNMHLENPAGYTTVLRQFLSAQPST